jgi:hypothetical protein
VIGGVYPYQYSLNDAPSGMTINQNTGEISWPNPTTTATGISITVVDTKGTSVTSTTWSVTVATTRFKFLSPSGNDTTGDGSLANPWLTLGKGQASGGTTGIIVMRAGTYDVRSITTPGSDGGLLSVAHGYPIIWVAYPSETVTWNFGASGAGDYQIDLRGNAGYAYFDGLTFTDFEVMGFYTESMDNGVWRRCIAHDYGPGVDGSNSAVFMFKSGGFGSGHHDRVMIQDCEFYNQVYGTGNCAMKIYATSKLLVENNYFHDFDTGGGEEAIANKAGNTQTTVRGCSSQDMLTGIYGGNQNAAATGECDVELCFNRFKVDSSFVMLLNHDGTQDAPSYFYRNTFEGGVIFDENHVGDGPFTFSNNVVINGNAASDNPADSGITHNTAPDTMDNVTVENHTFGSSSDGIVDANGLLTGSYRTNYLYLRGHEVPTL